MTSADLARVMRTTHGPRHRAPRLVALRRGGASREATGSTDDRHRISPASGQQGRRQRPAMAARDLDSYGVPGWLQAAPFGAGVRGRSSCCRSSSSSSSASGTTTTTRCCRRFTTRSYTESFEGCLDRPAESLHDAEDLCLDGEILLHRLGADARHRLHRRLFPRLPRPHRRRCRWCCSSSAPSRSGRRTSSA